MFNKMLKCLFCTLFSAGLVLVGLSAHSIEPDNVLVYWSFDELDGDMFKDESGNGYDAKLDGAGEVVEGKIGNAVNLTGGGIAMGPSNILETVLDRGEITIEASVFLNSMPNGNPALPYDGIISDDTAQFRIMLEGPHPYWNVGNRKDKRSKEFTFELKKWYHIVVLGDNENSKVYIDGVLIATEAQPADFKMPQNPIEEATIRVGSGEVGVWTVVDAIIDEVAIYDKMATEDEINILKVKGPGALLKVSVSPLDKLATTWGRVKAQY